MTWNVFEVKINKKHLLETFFNTKIFVPAEVV